MYVIVAGCGNLGAELARTLADEGQDVVVIDRDRTAFERLGSAFDGVTVTGTAIDEDVLRQAGIERADALAAVTGSDQVNLMVGQVATRVFGRKQVVVRVSDPALEDLYRRLGLITLRPGKSAVAQVRCLLGAGALLHILALGTGEVELVQFAARSSLVGEPVEHLFIHGKCQPLGVIREGRVLLPSTDLRLQEGDGVLAAIRLDARAAVAAWSRGGED
ncbi:MAG TPA: TrkA family potassium uptake protein [Firmicutes bacterium]|nr:TrkA family potassium uptake protein [Bacillota bacterium]